MVDIAAIERRLQQIHNRVQAIANAEARSALVNGWAAQGSLMAEKMTLLDETDDLLNKLGLPDA